MSSTTNQTRVAIITGAAQGIGRGIAIRLAADGLDVVVNDISPKEDQLREVKEHILSKSPNRRVLVITGDVSKEEDVKGLVDSAVSELGGLDVMVANAGIGLVKSIIDTSTEEWNRVHAINSTGVFFCYKYAAIQMIKQGRGGRIIGASSAQGKQAGAMLCAYASTKASIRTLTQTAAWEWGKYGITVNSYAPGFIVTPMVELFGDNPEAGFIDQVPLKRAGTPEDIAGMISYIASPDSSYVTGQSLPVNGGLIFT